ncbi:hypothetical protein ACFQFQ_32950 [Sulfitobacter porphyrae]|uniref:Uncharacterized protein n=1 Tax=Sulfitobacter porphyrae TaxID=1246864 RepID=A0ABW2BDI4_9RHOB
MIAALLDTFAKVQADPQVSVMILTGADPAFVPRRHQGDERPRQHLSQGAACGGAELCRWGAAPATGAL